MTKFRCPGCGRVLCERLRKLACDIRIFAEVIGNVGALFAVCDVGHHLLWKGSRRIEDDSVEAALASIEQALGGAIEDAEAPAAGLEGGSSGGSSSVRLAQAQHAMSTARTLTSAPATQV